MVGTKLITTVLRWGALIFIVAGPVAVAVVSPLQHSRPAVYIIGSMAGIVALALLLVQPLLAAGYLSGVSLVRQKRLHIGMGTVLVVCVALHIIGLYLASPDDMTDALLLRAPTVFSVYGVIGFWGLAVTAVIVVYRSRLKMSHSAWKTLHSVIAVIVVLSSVVHALWIQGTMGSVSKWILCGAILVTTMIVLIRIRILPSRRRISR